MQPRSGIVFHGTADPWAETQDIREGCEKLGLPLYITEGTNHSMETGDCLKDLQIMQGIMGHCNEYLSSEKTFWQKTGRRILLPLKNRIALESAA